MNFQRAKQLQESDLALLQVKNEDYGNSNILTTGIYGIGVRLQDKVARLLNLTEGNKVPSVRGESIADTLGDISNYGIIGRLLLEGQVGDPAGGTTAPAAASSGDYRTTDAAGRMVYLAGPIDMISEVDAREWREMVTENLVSEKWATFSPFGAVGNGPCGPGRTVQICLAAVLICDAVIVRLPVNAPAFGSIRELEYAKAHGKPVVVWSDWVDASLFSQDLVVVRTLDEVIGWLRTQ